MKVIKSLTNKIAIDIKAGKLAVIPTDTIYGLVASALNKNAIEKVYSLKKRAPQKPFIILISDISELGFFKISLSMDLLAKLSEYWPGPNSLIFQCDNSDLDYLTLGRNTLAFRMPANKLLRSFIRKTGPLIAPSANHEGQKPAVDIKSAIDYFQEKVDYYVDYGFIDNQPSNLIDLTNDYPVRLR
ncbi:MAG: L-threonylcarbamoyladenylate synthase [Candidatus Saccharibacteria bacterium]